MVSRQDYLNKINVFPVPDGDTGTNMAFTLSSILENTASMIHRRVDLMLMRVADAAIDSARGNSGAILAQFFQGLSDGTADVDKHSPESFSKALNLGAQYAKEALSEPMEGTILTVITDFSNEINSSLSKKNNDFIHLFEIGLKKAEESLKNTPNLLPILKKSGVVDSGAQGFVDLLNGINLFIKSGSIKTTNKITLSISDSPEFDHSNFTDELKFSYCTECLIKGNGINRKKIQKELLNFGDSIVIAGSKTRVKIHIHTNEPAKVFDFCLKFGVVSDQKIDDMRKQQRTSGQKLKNKIAILTDSGADLPFESEKLNIHIVPVRYNFGRKGYIDKVSQTPSEFYKELENNPIHPTTSQPTPGDFRRQYHFLSSHYNSIISIHLSKKLSGTFQSAQSAIKRSTNGTKTLIDSMSASVAQGLIVMYAAKLASLSISHKSIVEKVKAIIPKTHVFIAVNDLTYAVKGGRAPKSIKIFADIFRITPILTAKNGSMDKAAILWGKNNIENKFSKFIQRKMIKSERYIIQIAHCNNISGAKLLKSNIKKLKNIHHIYVVEMGCALGVHAGPGSLAVGIQEMNDDI